MLVTAGMIVEAKGAAAVAELVLDVLTHACSLADAWVFLWVLLTAEVDVKLLVAAVVLSLEAVGVALGVSLMLLAGGRVAVRLEHTAVAVVAPGTARPDAAAADDAGGLLARLEVAADAAVVADVA